MTPEERRMRVEYVVKMARMGIMAEPEYDHEEWRVQADADERAIEEVLKKPRRRSVARKRSVRRTA